MNRTNSTLLLLLIPNLRSIVPTRSFQTPFLRRHYTTVVSQTSLQSSSKLTTMSTTTKPKICVAGGGNAAHALAALLPHQGYETSLFAPFQDQAQQIIEGMASQDGYMLADFASHNVPSGRIQGRLSKVSKDAKDVIPGTDVIILPLPSFAYPSMLHDIKPYLQPNQILCVTPGQGGFDWFAKQILGDELLSKIVICGIMPMPFNCRIEEFGKLVKVQELKRNYSIGVLPQTAFSRCQDLLQDILHAKSVEPAGSGTMLECTLWPINAIIHPARLYTLLNDWKPGDTLETNPLFYEDFTKDAADMMDAINQDLIKLGKGLQAAGIPVGTIPHIFEWLAVHVYDEPKDSNLQQFFRTNHAYKGFRCPLIGDDSKGYVPDFTNRYFSEGKMREVLAKKRERENSVQTTSTHSLIDSFFPLLASYIDISLGLCGYRGLAEIVGVETPTFDRIISWAQGYMEKEYLVGTSLNGKDLGETNAPQRFGIRTIQDLKDLYGSA